MLIRGDSEIKKIQVGLELSFVVRPARHLHFCLHQVLTTRRLLQDALSDQCDFLLFCLFHSQIMQLPDLRNPTQERKS